MKCRTNLTFRYISLYSLPVFQFHKTYACPYTIRVETVTHIYKKGYQAHNKDMFHVPSQNNKTEWENISSAHAKRYISEIELRYTGSPVRLTPQGGRRVTMYGLKKNVVSFFCSCESISPM
ncbi:hypothetical protein CEXT_388981 [Caerostris extrusa]|uniref:Uncharacterized protein n=1 Tax=Caerostris extrusa TaxID=172846 RepID=A0AAV4VGT7_CAEEX|nr:hypothetical protein CEXT_388981 [Caerostris extrusa]